MRRIYIFGLITLVALIIGLAFADQMTFSTYYPAPYGVYREFTTTSKTCLATNPWGTDTNARVGIGTTEPNCKLVLREQAPSTYDPVNVTPETHLATFWIRGQSATDGAGLAIFAYPDTYAGMRSDYMQDTAMIYAPSGFDNPALGTKNLQITAADANGEIIFHTGGWGTTTTERMRIDEKGNVGIGTTAPDRPLLVIGDAVQHHTAAFLDATNHIGLAIGNAGASFNVASVQGFDWDEPIGPSRWKDVIIQANGGNVGIGTFAPAAPYRLHTKGMRDAQAKIAIEAAGSTTTSLGYEALIDFISPATATPRWTIGQTYYDGVHSNFSIRKGNTDIIHIRDDGRVGINNANPKIGYALDVGGNAYANDFVTDTKTYPDYVFAPEYQLQSIEEQAKFIQENRHLPSIPQPKKTVDDKYTVEIGTQQKGILEELEKAHLYIVQLHARIKALEEKLANLP